MKLRVSKRMRERREIMEGLRGEMYELERGGGGER